MSEKQLPKEVYDNMYRKYKNKDKQCTISVKDIVKARRIVSGVWKAFKLPSITNKTNILDIGCGLGFISEAFRELGGKALGVDISSIAIECAQKTFPLGNYKCMPFEDIIKNQYKFDVIWSLDFSLINTHDVDAIKKNFFEPCQNILSNEGIIILGWHTDYTGKTIGNFAHWNNTTISNLKKICDLSGPRIVQLRSALLSYLGISCCRVIRKSVPIFMIKNI